MIEYSDDLIVNPEAYWKKRALDAEALLKEAIPRERYMSVFNRSAELQDRNARKSEEIAELKAEVERLRSLVKEAFIEGYDDCYMQANEGKEPEECFQFAPLTAWEESESKKAQQQEDGE